MAKVMLVMTREAVYSSIPYSLICEARYGCRWNTTRRKRRWNAEFTSEEREKAKRLFNQSRDWTVGKGVPDEVRMTAGTLDLWHRLGDFCVSI